MTYQLLSKVRAERPLVHHITNWVTIYDCANIVRAFGALPVMAHSIEESADMARISNALVLNIGTLTSELVASMIEAGRAANLKGIPVILDAVGVGATTLRDKKAGELLSCLRIDIIKGNGSEIARLAGLNVVTRGVESTVVNGLRETAQKFAAERGAVVVITGKQDIITNGKRTMLVSNGHELMGTVVGTGCMSASVIGAFAAVEKNYLHAATAALACFGIAGELAASVAKGPGSFKANLYDEVYNLGEADVKGRANIEEHNS